MFNILITGIGGQGVITLAEIIADTAMTLNFDVKMSEIHGLAQRGGNLQCSVRIGEAIHSPIISRGEVDLLIALEPLETLREPELLSEKTAIVFDTHKIIPISVYSDKTIYPTLDEIKNRLEKITNKIFDVNATDETMRVAGNIMPLNIFMLGSAFYKNAFPKEFTEKLLLQSVKKVIGEKYFAANEKVFKTAKK